MGIRHIVAGINLHHRLGLVNIKITKFFGTPKRTQVMPGITLIVLPDEELTGNGKQRVFIQSSRRRRMNGSSDIAGHVGTTGD